MDRIPGELVSLLIVIGYLLYTLVVQWTARRRQRSAKERRAEPRDQGAAAPAAKPAATVPDWERFGRTQRSMKARPSELDALGRARRREVPPPPTAPGSVETRRWRARGLVGSRRDLRTAIVLMTVLGPCRALQDEERRDRDTI